MEQRPVPSHLFEDISLLYELSLSIGTSLELEANCEAFLQNLLERKDLGYAALWLKKSVVDGGGDGYRLVYATPSFRQTKSELAEDHPLIECSLAQLALTVRASNPGFKALITEKRISTGTFIIFRVGDIGVLKLHTPRDERPFAEREIQNLQSIFAKFCTSIEGCIAHALQKREIRERQAAEQEVARLKRFYEQILEAMPAQLAVFNADCEYVYITPSAIKNDEVRAWLIGKTDVDYAQRRGHSPRFAHQRMSTLQKAARNRETLQFEETITRKDGTKLHFVRFVSPISDSEDNVTHILGYGLDITPLKEAEAEQSKLLERLWENRTELLRTNDALQKEVSERKRAEKTLAGVLDTAGEGIIVINEASDIVMVNQAVERIWGYEQSELMGMTLDRLMPETYREAHNAGLARYVNTGISRVLGKRLELEGQRKDGTVFPLEVYITETRLKDQLLFTGAVRDISERRQAQEALRQSEVRYRSLVESANDIIYQADATGAFTYANPVAQRIMGYTEEELNGRHFLDLVHDEHREQVRAFYEDQIGNGIPSTYLEFRALTSDGAALWLGQNVQLVWEEEAVVGVQAVARDITERRQAEIALQEATSAVRESARVKEQFLANMSHEIRTPLNAVLGITHLLQNTRLSNEQEKYLQAIQFGADSLMGIVNDLLDYAKIEAGKIQFEAIPFDLHDLLRGLYEGVRYDTKKKGIDFDLDIDDSVPQNVVGDRVRLNQILLNLVNNAIKFTDEGGVRLHVTELMEQEDELVLAFTVKDTGIGIHPDKLADIFEMFSQERSDTTRKYGGTGLGLSIVSELVARQSGTIGVTSSPGEGAEFVVTLPFLPCDGEDLQTVQDHLVQADLSGYRILLVEDNELNQMMAQRMLEQWGAEVEWAGNGREAVQLVRERHYDLVLMDIQMPEMDGYEATRLIREDMQIGLEDMPILALTASPLVTRDEEMEAYGMNDCVLKPFDPRQLRGAISEHLGLTTEDTQEGANDISDESESLVDLTILEKSAFGRPEMVHKLVSISLGQIESMQRDLEQALADQNGKEVGFVAHKMKASAGTLGVTAWHQLLNALEVAAKEQGITNKTPQRVADSATFAARVRQELEEVLSTLE